MTNILVTGATGPLGLGVIKHLLTKKSPKQVFALARTDEKAAPLKALGVQVRIGDYDDYDSLVDAFQGIDRLYMVSNSDVARRFKQQDNVVDAAIEAGIGYIIYTSYSRKNESEDSPIRGVVVGHLNTEARLKESGIAYTILRHGMYADLIPILAGRDVLANRLIYFPAGHGKASMVLRADLAKAGAIVLLDESGRFKNKSIELAGSTALSWGDVADQIGSITDLPIKYVSPTVEEYTKTLTDTGVPAEYAGFFANVGKAMNAEEFAATSSTLEEVLGHKATPIRNLLMEVYGGMKVFLLVIAAAVLWNSSFGQNSRDEQSVKNVVFAYQDDYNDGAFKHVDSYTTKDWEHINPIGGMTRGRDEVMKELRPLCQTILKGVTLQVESITVRFLSPTVAMANVIHTCSDYEFPKGVKHHDERHMKTYIMVKKRNKWLLALDQNDIIVPL